MTRIDEKEGQKRLKDVEYASYYGCDQLEKEIRCDYYFYGKASELVGKKEELLRQKPRCCPTNIEQECFVSGGTRVIGTLKDGAVLLHGPISCATNQFLVGIPFDQQIFSSKMDEKDALLGGEQKLKEALIEVIERCNPGVVAVVGTCTTSITGDDLEGICAWAEKEKGIPVLALSAAGFYHRNWNFFSAETYNKLIDRMKPSKEKNKNSVNVFNLPAFLPNWKEFYDILPFIQEMGIKINTHPPQGRSFKELIERFPRAELNITRCPSEGLMACEYAEKKLGIPYLRLPRPIGLKYTEIYLRELARFFHVEDKAEAIIAREKEKWMPRLEKVKKRLQGKKIALQGGSGTVIGHIQLFAELGLEVVFMGPWSMDPTFFEFLKDWLETTGQDPEVMVAVSHGLQEPILNRLKPDIYMGMAEDRASYYPLGIATIDTFAPSDPNRVGFEGAVLYGETLAALVENKFFRKYHRYLDGPFPFHSSKSFVEKSSFAKGPCSRGQKSS